MPVLTFPKAFVYISRPYSAAHPASDLGWGATVGGATAPLLSPGDGRVAAVADGCGWDRARGWGNYIRIDHGDGFETLLAHCLRGSFTVKKGDSVSRGQAVCRRGNSGNCFTANDYHCHYVVLRGGRQVDPLLYTRLDESFQTVYDKTDSAYTIARLAANDAARCRVERAAARPHRPPGRRPPPPGAGGWAGEARCGGCAAGPAARTPPLPPAPPGRRKAPPGKPDGALPKANIYPSRSPLAAGCCGVMRITPPAE